MSQTNDEIRTVSPNIWRHGCGKPSLQLHRETSRRRAKMKVFFEQNINTHKSRNSTGVHNCRCRCKNKQSSDEWGGGDGRAGLLLHLQNGASWPAVLGAADAAELRRRVRAGPGQALLVEHVAAVEDQHAEGLGGI